MKKLILTIISMISLVLSACSTETEMIRESTDFQSDSSTSSEETSSFVFDIEQYKKELEESDMQTSSNVRGKLFDSEGKTLSYSEPDGNIQFIRVYSQEYAEAFAPLISDPSGGIDSINDSQLRINNCIATPNGEGQSLMLTLDADKQLKLYNILKNKGIVGCITAIKQDGALIAAVSTPSYDPNLYCTDPEYAKEINDSTNTPLICKSIEKRTPGSVFKIISCTLSQKHGFTTYYDQGYLTYQGTRIKNWDYGATYYPQQRDLINLFRNSSNSGFAQSFLNMSDEDILKDCRELFYLSDELKTETDFGSIHNSLKLTDKARSAFGQSDVKLSPVYVAMLTIGTVTGDIPQPYCISSAVNTMNANEVIEKKQSPKVLATIPGEYRKPTIEGMRQIAGDLDLDSLNTPVYAKTGTAEIDGQQDTLWITSCIQLSDKEYCAVVLQVRNTNDYNYTYASNMNKLYIDILKIIIEE